MTDKEGLQEARLLIEKGQSTEAQQILEDLTLGSTEEAEALCLLGQMALTKKEFKKASLYFKRALKKDPLHSEASLSLSVLLNDFGFYKEAEKVFSNLKKEESEESPLESLRSASKKDGVRPSSVSPESPPQSSWTPSSLSASVEKLQKLLKQNPKNYEARLYLGDHYYQHGQTVLAIREWSKILTMKPLYSPAMERLRNHRNKMRRKFLQEREMSL